MAIHHDRLPRAIASLPEPARTKAIETVNTLLAGGTPEAEAVEKAVAMAGQWIDERAPGDRSPERPTIERDEARRR